MRRMSLDRRGFLMGGLTVASAIGAPRAFASDASVPRQFMTEAERMLDQAVKAGDQGFGAVVVKDDRIVGFGPSQVVTNGDPTAHAEMMAIRDAARRLGPTSLSGAVLYSTSRPCAMCEAAAFWANLAQMIHGPALSDAGAAQLNRCG